VKPRGTTVRIEPFLKITHFRVGLIHGERLLAPKHVLHALGATIEPQGGLTIARGHIPETRMFEGARTVVGVSRCREDENFNKYLGRKIATHRALDAI